MLDSSISKDLEGRRANRRRKSEVGPRVGRSLGRVAVALPRRWSGTRSRLSIKHVDVGFAHRCPLTSHNLSPTTANPPKAPALAFRNHGGRDQHRQAALPRPLGQLCRKVEGRQACWRCRLPGRKLDRHSRRQSERARQLPEARSFPGENGDAALTTAQLTAHSQLWLLGYEFPATLFILTPDLLQIVTTKKKGASRVGS